MTVANGEGEPAGVGPPVDPFDPVALEARLAAARLRRRVALARRTVAGEDARPPAPATAVAAPPQPLGGLLVRIGYRRAGAFAACALCLLLAVPVGLLLPLRSTPASVAAVPPAKVTVGRAPVLADLVPAPAIVAVAAAPEPRPASHRAPAPGSKVARSARNGPRAITPPQAVRMFVRDVNAATLGTTAGALGLRERVAVPGAPLAVTLDRRGLRIIERPLRQRGRR